MDRDLLLAAGFKVKTYPDQEGEFLLKDMKLQNLPEAVQESLFLEIEEGDDQSAIVEVCPDQTIQFFVPAVEYHESYSLESAEGLELVRCAMQAK
ncbi:Uncharacterised protein [Achromobacter sp. 2789STDY5608633]|jgi:hypothetical protein|uniref:hypothetical protein n=1 Tax=Achromobacter sp. 2789STDY5608633 TaxID=1806501 RepID=UPI0006C64F61|nr:hypothetical protein [Achromobacter sp. 2789STDY5608633]CUJ49792.1 Uncharacterised protein [Achromobacter sp. 2789STDY5608633]